MTGEEFQHWRDKVMDWRQSYCAYVFGVHEDTIANWENNRRDVPKMAELLAILLMEKKNRQKVQKFL